MMLRLPKFITKTLSFKLSLMVLIALATLLTVALVIMFFFSRRALKEEALLKASQTLEATMQRIDNVLLSVEQSSGNIYWKVINHLDQPEMLEKYRQKLVEVNPYISHCTITLEPDEKAWYASSLKAGTANWTDARRVKGGNHQLVTSFCLPIYVEGKVAGLLAVDVPLTTLSEIVLATKPSPHSFCTLLGSDGSYIVHPDSAKISYQAVLSQTDQLDPSVLQTAEKMVAGESGYRHVHQNGKDMYVFYKPFVRSVVPGRAMEKLNWSLGIVYPEDDIFGDYNNLLYTVLVIAFVGLLLLMLLCLHFIHSQLRPLRALAQSAQRIAEGNYYEPIADIRHVDEVGRLQRRFLEMQMSLATRVGEMERLSATLAERGEVLQAAYDQAQAADRMKTSFLYNMTNLMMTPVRKISSNVKTVTTKYGDLTAEEFDGQIDGILKNGEEITALLNELIVNSEKKTIQKK